MRVIDAIKLIKKAKIKVFGQITINNHDMILVELIKQSVLVKLESFDDKEIEINVCVNKQGNVVIN